MRLRHIAKTADGENPQWNTSMRTVWQVVECNVEIVAACLPCLRSFFGRTGDKEQATLIDRKTTFTRFSEEQRMQHFRERVHDLHPVIQKGSAYGLETSITRTANFPSVMLGLTRPREAGNRDTESSDESDPRMMYAQATFDFQPRLPPRCRSQ